MVNRELRSDWVTLRRVFDAGDGGGGPALGASAQLMRFMSLLRFRIRAKSAPDSS